MNDDYLNINERNGGEGINKKRRLTHIKHTDWFTLNLAVKEKHHTTDTFTLFSI